MFDIGADLFRGAVWAGRPATAAELHSQTFTEAQQTFLRGMLEAPWKQVRRNPGDWALSVLVHAVILCGVILTPLFFTQVIDIHSFQVMFLAAPRPPSAPPAPAMAAQKAPRPARLLQAKMLVAPAMIPETVEIAREELTPPEGEMGGLMGGAPGGDPNGALGGIGGGVAGGALLAPPPPPPSVKTPRVVRVGGAVKPPRLLFAPPPQYSQIALIAQAQGTVVIDAIIDEHGNLVQAHAISGNPLLIPLALAAVLQWKYEPTYLDGGPVSISMHVLVGFALH